MLPQAGGEAITRRYSSRRNIASGARCSTAFFPLQHDIGTKLPKECARRTLLESYLSEGHRDAPGTGCALGALVGDMSRASRSARAVYTARLKRSLAYATGMVPVAAPADGRGRAILMISAMLGAINLSRAVSDPRLSREILTQTRDQLARFCQTADPPSGGAAPPGKGAC